MTTNIIKVSIIIRTINEESWIGKCISAIKKQSISNYEIIIVDSGSTDSTIQIAQLFKEVKVVKINKYLPGFALNEGIKQSVGKYIVMLSAHCIPCNENWIEILISNLFEDNVAGVYGKQLPVAFSDPRDVSDLYITFGDDKRVQKKDSFFHNANSAIKRSIWVSHPFKNEVTNIEDRIWGKEVTELGFNIIYEPNAPVYHYHGIHQSDNIERVENTINIIKSIDKKQQLYQLPDELLPENCNIITFIPIKHDILEIGNYDPLKLLVNTISESKYISTNYFLCDKSILKNTDINIAYNILGRPKDENYSLGELLKWGLEKINLNKVFPDYIIYLNPEYIFRSKGYLDMIINEIIIKGLDSVFTGYRDYSDYWFHSEEKNQYASVNTKLLSRDEKFPFYKSLFGLGTIVKPKLIRNKTLVSDQNVEIIYTDNVKRTLRVNNKNTAEIIGRLNEKD